MELYNSTNKAIISVTFCPPPPLLLLMSHFRVYALLALPLPCPLSIENTTSFTKPEVHNVLHYRQKRAELTCTENLREVWDVVFEICNIPTRSWQYFAHLLDGGEVNVLSNIWLLVSIALLGSSGVINGTCVNRMICWRRWRATVRCLPTSRELTGCRWISSAVEVEISRIGGTLSGPLRGLILATSVLALLFSS